MKRFTTPQESDFDSEEAYQEALLELEIAETEYADCCVERELMERL